LFALDDVAVIGGPPEPAAGGTAIPRGIRVELLNFEQRLRLFAWHLSPARCRAMMHVQVGMENRNCWELSNLETFDNYSGGRRRVISRRSVLL